MNKRSLLGIVALMALGAAAVVVVRHERPREVHAATATYRLLSPTIQASGTLAHEQEVSLVPEVPGRVLEILVKEGDRVQQGQLLIRLDASSIYAELAQLKAAAEEAQLAINRNTADTQAGRRRMSRFDNLASRGLIDRIQHESADSQATRAREELGASFAALDRANAGIVEAERRLANTDVRSPISGEVTAVLIEVGETALPGATNTAGAGLMSIAGTGSLYADVSVDETEIGRVRVGQSAKVVPAAFPDRTWEGKVGAVSIPPRDGQGDRFAVRIDLDSADAEGFVPGMSCRAQISAPSAGERRILAVPVGAVRYEQPASRGDAPKASVFVVDAGKARLRPVETGRGDDRHIGIVRGLDENDSVITGPSKALRSLREADKVTIVPPGTAS